MKQEITAAEAMEAIERLKGEVGYNRKTRSFCASANLSSVAEKPDFQLGWGATPLQAVAQLLERIGETATTQVEVASV